MSNTLITLNPIDNVGIEVSSTSTERKLGHKYATQSIASGSVILKNGHVIGFAASAISKGDWVHQHNVRPMLETELNDGPQPPRVETQVLKTGYFFQGYRRSQGLPGIRNYVLVVSSVNCSATVVKAVAQHFRGKDLNQVHGVIPVTHSLGCGQDFDTESYEFLGRTLTGWISHPNVVGAVIIGLGCEGTTPQTLLKSKSYGKPILTFSIQETEGTKASIAMGISKVEAILKELPQFKRERFPLSDLRLALNCGGSDLFSSISANPVLGVCSDLICAHGGGVALAEIPECHGAEALLFQRTTSDTTRTKLKSVFEWWKNYANRHQLNLESNLSPGNIEGGITTLAEKSLGALMKAGSAPLANVVDYAESVEKPGFTLMNTPGYDPCSVTGLVAGGCQVVAFTTGRGSTFGCAIAPTIKIATTSSLFKRMKGDMDFDAGRALMEGSDVKKLGEELLGFTLTICDGSSTKSEELGLGWEEFVPWSLGDTL